MDVAQMRRREEQLEKAHLRGKQALRREHLEQVNVLSGEQILFLLLSEKSLSLLCVFLGSRALSC